MRRTEPDRSPEAAALAEARWTASDLVARRPAELAPDLLRGQAAELSTGVAEHDRLLARFLEAAADDIEHGRPPLQDRDAPGPLEAAPPGRPRPGVWWWAAAMLLAAGCVGIFAAVG